MAKKVIDYVAKVEVGYYDFEFKSVMEAMTFAIDAASSITKENGAEKVSLTVTFSEAEEEDEKGDGVCEDGDNAESKNE